VAGGNLVVDVVHKVIFAMIAQSWRSVIKITGFGKPRNLAIFTWKLLKNIVQLFE